MARLLSSELAQWHELELQRLEYNRLAKDLAALQEPLEEKFAAYVAEKGGKARAVTSCGFTLKLTAKRGSVQWKNEFVRVAGPDGPKLAEAIIAAQPTKDVLSIEPPTAPASA